MNNYLIKIVDKKYKKKVLSGKLHFTPIDYFINNGNDAQKDWFEGQTIRVSRDKLKELFPMDMVNIMSTDVCGIYRGYKYVHIMCLSLVGVSPTFNPFITQLDIMDLNVMKEFGDVCLIIKDPEALLKRIIHKCNKLGYLVMGRKTHYYKEKIYGIDSGLKAKFQIIRKDIDNRDLFTNMKDDNLDLSLFSKVSYYLPEREFRIAVLSSEKTLDPFDIDIGDIKDIVDIENVDDNLPSKIFNMIRNSHIKPFDASKTYSNSDLSTINEKAKRYDETIEYYFYM